MERKKFEEVTRWFREGVAGSEESSAFFIVEVSEVDDGRVCCQAALEGNLQLLSDSFVNIMEDRTPFAAAVCSAASLFADRQMERLEEKMAVSAPSINRNKIMN